MVGSLVLGMLTGVARHAGADAWVVSLVGAGFCGALTTFSGFAAQVAQLTAPDGARWSWRGAAYALLSVALGLVVAAAGYALTR